MESNKLLLIKSKTTKTTTVTPKCFSYLHISVILLVIAVLTGHITKVNAQNRVTVETEPTEIIKLEGDSASFLCRTGVPALYCRIKIPGENVLNLSPDWTIPRFLYYGDGLQNGQCGVTIEKVTLQNHGQIECNIGVRGVGSETTGKMNLIVAVTPHHPQIEVLTHSRNNIYEVDQEFVARCIVSDGRPAANITWFLDNEPIFNGLGRREEVESPDNRNTTLITTIQEIHHVLTPRDNGKQLTCRATHITDRDRPQESHYQFFVRYRPQVLPDIKVYGLTIGSTAIINVTIEANPRPRIDWTVDGVVIPQGVQNGRYEAYEPIDLGNGLHNVTLSIAGLTLEDTNKVYYLKASNELGTQDYTVRISSSNTPASSGLDAGAIVGIVVAIIILLIVVLLIIFARATGRWCFAGKSSKTTTSETSDTESTEVKVSKFRKLPKFDVILMRKSEKTKIQPHGKNKDGTISLSTVEQQQQQQQQQNEDELRLAAAGNNGDDGILQSATELKINDGNDNQPKEDKQLVYAELVLKPSDDKPAPPKPSTEYAEIVYVQKQAQDDSTKNQKK